MSAKGRARRAALCGVLAAGALLASGPGAAAAQTTTVGATGYDALFGTCLPGTQVVGRDAATQDGTITQFRFTAGRAVLGGSAQFQLLRPAGGGRYTVVARTAAISNPRTGAVTSAAVSIPVQTGDVLGLTVTGAMFPCYRKGTPGDYLGVPLGLPTSASTIQSVVPNPLGLRLNLEATITPPPLLVRGKGTNVVGTRFDFEVRGTPESPVGSGTFTSADWVRSGRVTCYRQIAPNRALFGIKDVTGGLGGDPVYREFYVSDNANGDRQTEWGLSSTEPPPVGCRTDTPPVNAGWRVNSGDITFTDTAAG